MENDDPNWRFTGFSNPNFTTVPDELFDELVPRLNGAEVKALLYIVRRTFGFKKERDSISISQMLHGIVRRNGERLDHGAGLSKPTLLRALATLAEKEVIIATRQFDFNGSNLATSYQLHMGKERRGGDGAHNISEAMPLATAAPEEETAETLGQEMRQAPLSQNLPEGLSQNLPKPLVKNRDTQETGNKRQVKPNVNVGKDKSAGPPNPLHLLPDALNEPRHIALIGGDILLALGDRHSTGFYHLVARKVPETVIRRSLAEIKQGKVRSGPKVFTHDMMAYAATHLERAGDRAPQDVLAEGRQRLVARMTVHGRAR